MDRINGANTIDIGGGNRGFRDRNAVGGLAGTEVTADFLNGVQEEILKVITAAGLTPDAEDLTQLWQAIVALVAAGVVPFATLAEVLAGTETGKALDPAKLAAAINSGAYISATDTGAANALVVTLAPPPAAYGFGMRLRVKVAASNTGAATINVNGLGAKSITLGDATALPAGALIAGAVVTLTYDGTRFQLANPTGRVLRGMQVYSAAGTSTFIVPDGVFAIRGRVCGGGGSGGGSTASGTGGGGGAGGYAEGLFAVTPGQSISITVGAGGAAVTSGNNGNPGGSSSIGAFMSATGGNGGASPTSAAGALGGVGSGGSINLYGGFGTDGWSSGTGTGGSGGASYFGGGLRASANISLTNAAPGSGGGAIYAGNTGGMAGVAGIVILEW